jgi:hypothetical protein
VREATRSAKINESNLYNRICGRASSKANSALLGRRIWLEHELAPTLILDGSKKEAFGDFDSRCPGPASQLLRSREDQRVWRAAGICRLNTTVKKYIRKSASLIFRNFDLPDGSLFASGITNLSGSRSCVAIASLSAFFTFL